MGSYAERAQRIAVALLTGGLLVSCSAGDGSDDHHVMAVGGSARFPNASATDWVTYADHVVVATVASERALPLGQEEQENEEGSVERRVELRVDELLWSADAPRHEAPTGPFEMTGWGWVLRNGERIPTGVEGMPRLEVGHTYIVALTWLPERADEPTPIPARWDTLGPESVVPYDHQVIGAGEGAETGTFAHWEPHGRQTVERELAGEDAHELRRLLEETEPATREAFG